MNFEFLIPIAFFLVVAFILREFWLYRLRKALIEKGNVDENVKILADTSAGSDSLNSIKWGMVLAGIGIASGDSVLDVGCGFAELYSWLESHGLAVVYTGIDVSVCRFWISDLLPDCPPAGKFLIADFG